MAYSCYSSNAMEVDTGAYSNSGGGGGGGAAPVDRCGDGSARPPGGGTVACKRPRKRPRMRAQSVAAPEGEYAHVSNVFARERREFEQCFEQLNRLMRRHSIGSLMRAMGRRSRREENGISMRDPEQRELRQRKRLSLVRTIRRFLPHQPRRRVKRLLARARLTHPDALDTVRPTGRYSRLKKLRAVLRDHYKPSFSEWDSGAESWCPQNSSSSDGGGGGGGGGAYGLVRMEGEALGGESDVPSQCNDDFALY